MTCLTPGPVGATWPSRLQGRLYPSIRELVRFEQWPGRTSLVVLSSPRAASFVVPGDAEEFAWAGARVLTVGHDPETWSVPAGSVDLVYAFLSLDVRTLEAAAAVIYTALRPGGTVVAVFRHSRGLHYMARVRQYFGQVCDLAALAGPAFVRLVEDDDASDPRDYVGREELETAFRAFTERTVTACGLAPEDLGPLGDSGYPPTFWLWLARACGRFLVLKASK